MKNLSKLVLCLIACISLTVLFVVTTTGCTTVASAKSSESNSRFAAIESTYTLLVDDSYHHVELIYDKITNIVYYCITEQFNQTLTPYIINGNYTKYNPELHEIYEITKDG